MELKCDFMHNSTTLYLCTAHQARARFLLYLRQAVDGPFLFHYLHTQKSFLCFYRLPFTQRDDIFSQGTVLFFLPVFKELFMKRKSENLKTKSTCSHISTKTQKNRECVRNLDLWVQVHPGELWVSKQRVHIVLEASKSAGAKGGVPKICGFMHPLHLC